MINTIRGKWCISKNRKGFTLIELLIVIVILGMLAMIIVPQVSFTTEDARTNTVKANLSMMRSGVEIYYAQHKNAYPGVAVPSTKPADVTTAAQAFVAQLTRYTDDNGNISNTKDATYKYGPYIKGGALPTNPYNSKADITIDATETNVTVKASGGAGTGWKFYALTGVVMAADGANDSL